jgi:hypothetical protein
MILVRKHLIELYLHLIKGGNLLNVVDKIYLYHKYVLECKQLFKKVPSRATKQIVDYMCSCFNFIYENVTCCDWKIVYLILCSVYILKILPQSELQSKNLSKIKKQIKPTSRSIFKILFNIKFL